MDDEFYDADAKVAAAPPLERARAPLPVPQSQKQTQIGRVDLDLHELQLRPSSKTASVIRDLEEARALLESRLSARAPRCSTELTSASEFLRDGDKLVSGSAAVSAMRSQVDGSSSFREYASALVGGVFPDGGSGRVVAPVRLLGAKQNGKGKSETSSKEEEERSLLSQDVRDAERDSAVVNGSFVSGRVSEGGGYDAMLESIVNALIRHERSILERDAWEIAKGVMRSANRTQSAGDA